MIVLRVFGLEVLAFGREDRDDGPGDVTTTPVGFVMLDGSTRYEPPPGGSVE